MEEFYRRLQAGMARANALKTKYPAPLYWGYLSLREIPGRYRRRPDNSNNRPRRYSP